MSEIVFLIGAIIFLAHFLSLAFKKTNLPDVLVLMGLGLLVGPVMHWVTPQDFGKIGPIIATIALVVILFEGGTSLRLDVMAKALKTTGVYSLGCFVLTTLIVAVLSVTVGGLGVKQAILLGIILGGTSSAVVIPMVNTLRLGQRTSTVLVLESALTDVLCIVGSFAMIQIILAGHVEPGKLVGNVLSSLVFAGVLGILGGMGWLLILGKVRDFPNTISSTIAYAFIVYGFAELLGFSGAIASLSFGITLTNFEQMGLTRLKFLNRPIEPLTDVDRAFFSESVFLLKTYFFLYLGISIRFNGWTPVLLAMAMMVLVFVSRIIMTRSVLSGGDYSPRDSALASMLAPKGLAAAVLASVPAQFGIEGAEAIRDAAYMVVLVSICLCACLVVAYPLAPVNRAYTWMLSRRPQEPASDKS